MLAEFKQPFETYVSIFLKTENQSPTGTQETRDRILDAAESLFADNGFRAVSLRQITTEAGVNLAAVNYHFGGKDGLIYEVLTRVVGPINEERLSSLDLAEADAQGDAVPIRTILDAFFRPVVNQLAGAHHNSQLYLKLAGRCLSESEEHSPETLLKLFEKVADRFVAASAKSLPHLSEVDIYWRLHFSVGTLLHSLAKGSQLVLFSRGKIPSVDPAETLDQLIQYTAGGMESPPIQETPDEAENRHLPGSGLRAGSQQLFGGVSARRQTFCPARCPRPLDGRERLPSGPLPGHLLGGSFR